MNAGDDANGGELSLLGAGQYADRHFDDALGLSDELGTVLGFARRRRGDRLDPGHAHLVDQRAKAAERPQRTRHSIGAKPPSGGNRAPEAAQHLFVEQRGGRPRRALIDHEPHRVRTDVDHGDGAQLDFCAP